MLTQLTKLKLTLAMSATLAAAPGMVLAASTPVGPQAASSTATAQSSGNPGVQQQAASQRFHDAKRCFESGVEMGQLSARAQICRSLPAGTPGSESCAAQAQSLHEKLQANGGRAAPANCSGDPQVVQTQFRDAVITAAGTGDVDAQLCYVQGWFPLASPADVPTYKTNASAYMAQAFSRGDWRVVQLLIEASQGAAHGGAGLMINFPYVGTPFTIYRGYRLLSLGATGAYAISVKAAAEDMRSKLTPAQVTNANTWAAQEYRRHFSKSPPLVAAPVPCFVASRIAEQ